MPELRELHHGVSDLFLHDRRRFEQCERNACRALAAVGFVLHAEFFVHPRRQYPDVVQIPVSAVDYAQAGGLDRSIRNAGMRGLRPLHHVVPGRD